MLTEDGIAARDPPAVCEACGEPATRLDCEGVPLCEADYAHLLEHWRLERLDKLRSLYSGPKG